MMDEKIKSFIQDNLDLIEQNTKKSWEELYSKLNTEHKGKFTQVMLEAGIDPVEKLGYIPKNYLYLSKIDRYIIPNRVTNIGSSAFSECHSLTEIIIPNSVTSIGQFAFRDCFALKGIEIPSSVISIGSYAFEYCNGLISVNYKGTKEEALTMLNLSDRDWERGSSIEKIICSDGVIDL